MTGGQTVSGRHGPSLSGKKSSALATSCGGKEAGLGMKLPKSGAGARAILTGSGRPTGGVCHHHHLLTIGGSELVALPILYRQSGHFVGGLPGKFLEGPRREQLCPSGCVLYLHV